MSDDSLTYFHASEHVVYLLIAFIIIIATFFDSCPFICGSNIINGVLVALSQFILILQKQGWGLLPGLCFLISSVARLVGIDDETDKP